MTLEENKNYVCPQCGPDPAGDDSHTLTHHTFGDGLSWTEQQLSESQSLMEFLGWRIALLSEEYKETQNKLNAIESESNHLTKLLNDYLAKEREN